MDPAERLKLLKALPLLDQIPAGKLADLGAFLEPLSFADAAVIFEEGSTGDCLLFISSGQVRIQKRVVEADGTPSFKDLAVLGPGDCFGEMALFEEEVPRSARAAAQGETTLFTLGRKDLLRWLDSNPALAVGFFTELVRVLSRRLRRSSNELTLLFDLSRWLLEPIATGKELLQKVLRHLVPHLEGSWTAGAYLYNEFNDEMDLVATEGDFAALESQLPDPKTVKGDNAWLDERTYLVPFPAEKHMLGYLVFRSAQPLNREEKGEIARTLTTTARLISSALQNISHRAEDALRARLQSSRQSARL